MISDISTNYARSASAYKSFFRNILVCGCSPMFILVTKLKKTKKKKKKPGWLYFGFFYFPNVINENYTLYIRSVLIFIWYTVYA